ncbi:hypothetical protein [Cyanobium sp. CH-040]|uniref:hypothetical protein n=1 Tax=Cyanobium sp. CH-040 TaxID=2823708 RepID=UPI0020CFB5F1|nr:hypothetical protein [Cyanobium sp. CH-040]MCP9926995.1 hypothetical protein [Cyanobium sp. CH-040]
MESSPQPVAQGSGSDGHPSREQILAASSGWVAVLLNIVPGLGTGYIYQRRWRAYWLTSAAAALWFGIGAVQDSGIDPVLMPDLLQRNQLVGLAGFLLLALGTAVEAGLALRRSRG